jgi:POT family proton-dependent oligopeptide transporter
VGLLKPNVSAIVADLYPEGGARLDSGFTVFYIGINVGAFLGPLVTGAAQLYFGLRAGFAAAALFMALGVVQFYLTRRHLGTAGAYIPSASRGKQWLYLWVAVGLSALLLAAVSAGLIPVNAVDLAQAVTYVIVAWRPSISFTTSSRRASTPKNVGAASCSWCCSPAARCSGRATSKPVPA